MYLIIMTNDGFVIIGDFSINSIKSKLMMVELLD